MSQNKAIALLERIELVRQSVSSVIGKYHWVCPICKCEKGGVNPHLEKCELGQALALLRKELCKTCGGSGEKKVYKDPVVRRGWSYHLIPCPDCKAEEAEAGEFTKRIRNRIGSIRTEYGAIGSLESTLLEACNIIDRLNAELKAKDELLFACESVRAPKRGNKYMSELPEDLRNHYQEEADNHADFLAEKVFKPAFVIAFIHGAKHGREDVLKELKEKETKHE